MPTEAIEDDIDLALSLEDKFWRLKFILADNSVEIALFNIARRNSFDEWHHKDGNSKPSDRISLFYSFPKKVEYAIDQDEISGARGHFNKKNSELKSSLPEIFEENLRFRLQRLKDSLAFVHIPGESFQTIELDLEDFQRHLDHIFANYGKQAVEKSNFLDRETKEYYLKLYQEHPDYLDPEKIDEDMKIVETQDIREWENKIDDFEPEMKNHVALTKWHAINKRLSLLEEINEYYVWVAC